MDISNFMDEEKHYVVLSEHDGFDIKMECDANVNSTQDDLTINNNVESSSSESLEALNSSQSTSFHSRRTQPLLPNSHKSASTKRKRLDSEQNSTPIATLADKLLQKEEDEINESLAQFFFGCNIPLNVVDSVYFKNFIRRIRPAYAEKIPSREFLSTRLLDKAYQDCLSSTKATVASDSVLLMNVWKDSSNNNEMVVSILQNTNGENTFLEAWDLTAESITAEKFANIVTESIDLAEKIYATQVYAVVSDSDIVTKENENKMKHFIWKNNCSIKVAKQLGRDSLNKELNQKVITVLKEYKKPELEKKIIEKGGTIIKLTYKTQPWSYRNALNCLIENEPFMKQIQADSKVKSNVVALLFDTQFVNEVKSKKLLLDEIFNIIKKFLSSNCSAAEAVEVWLNLPLPDKFSKQLKSRLELVLNQYALAAFYLHPYLDKTILNSDHNNIIFEFLFNNLDGAGLEELDSFKKKTGFFQRLYEKDIKKPLVFWSMAEMKHPNLSKLAIKLLNIPATSAQIERISLNCDHVKSSSRNPLTFQQSKKLLHIYHTLSMRDDEDEEEQ